MERGDGVAIARYARSRAPGIHIVLLTSHPLVPTAENALVPSPTVLRNRSTTPCFAASLRRSPEPAPAIDVFRVLRLHDSTTRKWQSS